MSNNMRNTIRTGRIVTPINLLKNTIKSIFPQWINNFWFYGRLLGQQEIIYKCWSDPCGSTGMHALDGLRQIVDGYFGADLKL